MFIWESEMALDILTWIRNKSDPNESCVHMSLQI